MVAEHHHHAIEVNEATHVPAGGVLTVHVSVSRGNDFLVALTLNSDDHNGRRGAIDMLFTQVKERLEKRGLLERAD